MRRSQRIQRLVRLAERREHEAACALRHAAERLNACRTQCQALSTFQAEYLQPSATVDAHPRHASQLKNRRAFLDRLTEGISQAQLQVAAAEAAYTKACDEWSARRARTKALAKVAQRRHARERRGRLRAERCRLEDHLQHGR